MVQEHVSLLNGGKQEHTLSALLPAQACETSPAHMVLSHSGNF